MSFGFSTISLKLKFKHTTQNTILQYIKKKDLEKMPKQTQKSGKSTLPT
jgi:hypothetical protein